MGDQGDGGLPPLGEPTPVHPARSSAGSAWYRRAWVVGLASLVVGLLVGFGLASVFDDDGNDDVVAMDDEGPRDPKPTQPPTPTTAVTVPEACVEAMRSAQQSLTVLDQGFQGLRRFDAGDVDRTLTDLQELRGKLTERVRECLERT